MSVVDVGDRFASADSAKVWQERIADVEADGRHACTDLGNAERFADQHRSRVAYAAHRKAWMIYDGRQWAADDLLVTKLKAAKTVRSILVEAANEDDGSHRSDLIEHAKVSEGAARIRAMLELAQPLLARGASQFDADPLALNVLNGTLDLRSMELRPHRADDFLTKLAPVAFDPAATCPRWDAFLARVLPDAAVREYVKRAAGYFLTAETTEHAMFIAHGSGANGKSVLLSTLAELMGDYARTAEANTFLARQQDSVRNDLAALAGARLVSISEVEAGRRLAESLVKQATGGDAVTARFLYGEFFEFRPTFKILMAANHKPVVRGTDEGIWRRIRLIPFTVTIPEVERDKDLGKKLLTEGSGILNWALAGCLAWQREGLTTPPAVRAAGAEYREEMDPLGAFLEEMCVLEPGASVATADLYQAYVGHAEAASEQPIRQRAFTDGLRAHGCEARKGTKGRRMWLGIRLNPGGGVAQGGATFPMYATRAHERGLVESGATDRHPPPDDDSEVLQ
jgi:putative DNA primase/helicase